VDPVCYYYLLTRSRATDPVQVMDEAKDSIPSLQLSKHEILTGYVIVSQCMHISAVFVVV